MTDDERAYRAVSSRDARFDGVFVTAVATTGIYCRPSCPARTPARENVRFFPTTAAARQAGFRACKRCVPDAAPGSPEWNLRADLAARAMAMIGDGVVDRDGVEGLARRLGYSPRQVRRQLRAELGVGPLELARSHRVDTARALLESSALSMADVAFASGYSSIRQFNESIRAVLDERPSEIRARRAASLPRSAPGGQITVRLPYRAPLALAELLEFLGRRAVPGVEEYRSGTYRRTLRLPRSSATLSIAAAAGERPHVVTVELVLGDLRDLTAAVARTRRLLDLDADPLAVAAALGADPLLAPLVESCPGRRVPGHPDAEELAVRALLGQQVSIDAARRLAATLVERFGEPVKDPAGALTHTFPTPAVLAAAGASDLPLPAGRRAALQALARLLAEGEIDLSSGSDRDRTERALLAIPGIGPWTAAYVRMRGLGDPDAFPASDLGLKRALELLGQSGQAGSILARAERWRPWRAYALVQLWSVLETLPGDGSPPGARRHRALRHEALRQQVKESPR